MPTTEAVSTIAVVKPAAKEKKAPASKQKSPKNASHPPYFEMIKEALLALKEKGGSSPYAIAKYIEGNQKYASPANFPKILGQQLKNSAAKGKLIKVKASYKLSDTVKKAAPEAVSAKKKGKKARQIVDDAARPAKKKGEHARQIADAAANPKKAEAVKKAKTVAAPRRRLLLLLRNKW